MTAFALDANHDMHLGPGGSLARVVDADYVVQSLETRLLLYKEEWWLDLSDGTPWFQEILVQPAAMTAVERALKRRILETENVVELLSVNFTYDAAERDLVVQFEVLTEFGPSGVVAVNV